MANFASTIARGNMNIKAFSWYVTNNPRYSERDYYLEVTTSFADDEKSSIAAGTKLKILDSQLNKQGLVNVEIGNKVGYIPVSSIKIPRVTAGILTFPNVSQAINDYILEQGCPINIRLKGEKIIWKNISYAVDQKINKLNPRANLILCQSQAPNKIIDRNSIYISYKPRNIYKAQTLVGENFDTVYTNDIEYKAWKTIYEKAEGIAFVKMSLFGRLANIPLTYNLNHIHCLAAGRPYFRPIGEGNIYELNFDKVHLTSTYISNEFLKSKYVPVIDEKKNIIYSSKAFK